MFGAKPGLERMLRLAEASSHPERQLRFIHVAGTNGKGSTCAMLESVYRKAGLKVGLFTSPHLVAFSERIQINRRLIPQSDVARLTEQVRPVVAEMSLSDAPTFFEVVTLLALLYFAENKCDLVIWETGLGGRLDATNIVQPLASVITNIHYDHERWLGHTLEQIASEKTGIIKPGTPAVVAANPPEVLEVVQRRVQALNAPLVVIKPGDSHDYLAHQIQLPLPGEHQRANAATAIATVRVLHSILPVSDNDLKSGLESVHWPGRLQRVFRGTQEFVLDGAHNPGGVEALCATLQQLYPDKKPAMIVGILRDKNWQRMLSHLKKHSRRLFLVTVGSERAATAEELRQGCGPDDPQCPVTCHASLADALQTAQREPLVVICGSLYLVGEAMELLNVQLGPENGRERKLNEWGGVPCP